MARRRLFHLLKQWPSPLCSAIFCTLRSSALSIPNITVPKRTTHKLQTPSKPRVFSSLGWEEINPSVPVEEESIPTYGPEKFYPARIGEVLNDRYQVVGKLGYGSSATVWLARDLLEDRYLAIKVYTASAAVTREIEVYNHLRNLQSDHAGQSCLRPLIEAFQISNPDGHGAHYCLVHPPLGISLSELTPLLPDRVMSSAMVRTTIRKVLAALDFLHTEAEVIHTDLQPSNMLLGIKDHSIFPKFEQAELENPVSRKTLEDRGDIMPDIYRAPEVILGMKWDYKVDIWNVGMLIWDLFEHRHLFKARNPERKLDDGYHLAEMQAVLGAPPIEFLSRSEYSLEFWDESGKWIGAAPVPDHAMEDLEERLQGDEQADFIRFLRRALCWVPEERATAKELLFDPWLMQGLLK
ncbi:kinase-like domain-containing protein [Aspergillus heterothallicus]